MTCKTKKLAQLGILLGVIVVITTIEFMFIIPFMPPHTKPGFANIVVMFCVFKIGKREAVALNILKSLFVLATRGFLAGLLSFSGGLLSIIVVILLASYKKFGFAFIGAMSAIAHNLGQLLVVMLILTNTALMYYAPILVVSGVITGLVTGTLLKTLINTLGAVRK